MNKSVAIRRSSWGAAITAAVFGVIALHLSVGARLREEGKSNATLRNPDYPNTHISLIDVDITSPNHWVTLTWTGPNAKSQSVGPFRSSPGRGLGNNDCDDVYESNKTGSHCTPKGRRIVEGFSDSLPSNDKATFATWFDMKRGIAFHYYPDVPDYPASAGCIRLGQEAALLIHENAVVGRTVVEIHGKWTRPVNRQKLRDQLIAHEGKRELVYRDSLSHPTIGVGFNMERVNVRAVLHAVGADYERLLGGKDRLSNEQIEALLERDINEALTECKSVFPDFCELSDVRQRVLVDMMFNLGRTRFNKFKKMIGAVRDRDFELAAQEMKRSKWHDQVKRRALTLEWMMRNNLDKEEAAGERPSEAIVDCQMTLEEAFDNLDHNCPTGVRDRQELVEVEHYSFDDRLHRGQLVVDRELEEDVQIIFQIARDYRVPIESVIPLSDPRFWVDGVWDNESSMKSNNTSAFHPADNVDGTGTSNRSVGRVIDINPMLNPYVADGTIFPEGAAYDTSQPGTFSSDHPVVQAFIELGWEWGGFWEGEKHYARFEKLRSDNKNPSVVRN